MPLPLIRRIAVVALACVAGAAPAQEAVSIGPVESEEMLGRWMLVRGAEGTCVVSAAADSPEGARLVAGIAEGKVYRVLAVTGLEDGAMLGLSFSNGFSAQGETTVHLNGGGLPEGLVAMLLVRPDPMEPHPHVQIVGGQLAVVLPADVRRNNPRAVDEAYAWIAQRRIQRLRSDADLGGIWRSLAQSSRVTVSQGGARAEVSLAGSSRALRALAACADG